MDILQRRAALAEALSSHQVERIKPFLHPSYVIRGTDGQIALDCRGFLLGLPRFFHDHPEYRQSIEVERAREEECTATLTTRHVDMLRTWFRVHPVDSRWDETWHKVGGEWLLVEERPHVEGDQGSAERSLPP